MSRYEDYPHKCVKCGATDVELHKFTYAKSKGKLLSESFSTVHISFPVCANCKQDFDKSLKLENAARSMKYVTPCSLIIAISMAYSVFSGIGNLWLLLVFILTSALTITGVLFFIRAKSDPNKIGNYISFKKTGKIDFKDKEFEQEIVEHMLTKKVEQGLRESTGIGMITCPKCGSQQQKETDFCNNCGKELRNL